MTNWGSISLWNTISTWGEGVTETPTPVADSGTQGPPPPDRKLPGFSWTIDGMAVRCANWSASISNEGGFDQMRGSIPVEDWRMVPTGGQGSIVKGFTDDGNVRWEGRMSAKPQIARGVATFAAQGYRVKAEKKTDRLFIQSSDIDIWQPVDGDPFVNASGAPVYSNNSKISCDSGKARLIFKCERNVDLLANRANGYAFYAEGESLSKVSFVMNYDAADETSNLAIRVQSANGPVGTETTQDSFNTTVGNRNALKNAVLGDPNDLILVNLFTNAAFTPSDKLRYALNRVRVWGSVTTANSYNAYEAMTYIGDTLGYDTSRITGDSFDILPFDWDGGSWADAASYIAELEDKCWRVLDDRGNGPVLEYVDWGERSWTVYLQGGAEPDLTPQEQFNKVWVWFESPSGVRRRKTAMSDPDPLEASGVVNLYEYELEDRQGDDANLAERVADKLARRVSRLRYTGRIDVVAAFDESGANDPFGILPGDTVRIADWDVGESVELRVYEVDLRPDGVTLGVEQPLSLARLLKPRRRRKRK